MFVDRGNRDRGKDRGKHGIRMPVIARFTVKNTEATFTFFFIV